MKKVLNVCLIVLMVFAMSVSVFAAPGSFVSSPSGNPVPEIVDIVSKHDDCTAQVVITPFADRDSLPDDIKALIEKAYNDIANTKDLASLNEDLAKIAKDKNIDPSKLAISDFFDISGHGCGCCVDNINFDMTLEVDTLDRFVGLLYINSDGEWVLIDNAKVNAAGDRLTFSVDSFNPVAIVIDTTVDMGDAPGTGNSPMIQVYALVMVIAALAVVVILLKENKKKLF